VAVPDIDKQQLTATGSGFSYFPAWIPHG